jgi:hypothetical protein
MEKTGKEVKPVDSLPLRFGSFAEEFVANEYAKATGFALRHDESIYIHSDHSYISAHIDRFVHTDGHNWAYQNGLRIQSQSQGCPVVVVSLGHGESSGSSWSWASPVQKRWYF